MSTVATTLWVAQEKGFFAKNSLDVQSIFYTGSPTLIASLNIGDGAQGVKNIQRFMKLRNPKIADVNLERLIDESLLRELDKTGFIEQAFGGKTVR